MQRKCPKTTCQNFVFSAELYNTFKSAQIFYFSLSMIVSEVELSQSEIRFLIERIFRKPRWWPGLWHGCPYSGHFIFWACCLELLICLEGYKIWRWGTIYDELFSFSKIYDDIKTIHTPKIMLKWGILDIRLLIFQFLFKNSSWNLF